MPLNFFGNQDRASIQRGRKSPSSSPTTEQQFNVEEKVVTVQRGRKSRNSSPTTEQQFNVEEKVVIVHRSQSNNSTWKKKS